MRTTVEFGISSQNATPEKMYELAQKRWKTIVGSEDAILPLTSEMSIIADGSLISAKVIVRTEVGKND